MTYMPLIHHARYLIKAIDAHNPFATDETIKAHIETLATAYMRCPNPVIGLRLMSAINDLEYARDSIGE